MLPAPPDLLPGRFLGLPGHDVDPEGEAGRPARPLAVLSDAVELLPERVERLQPGEVVVRVATGGVDGGRRRAGEVDLRERLGGQRCREPGPLHLVEAAVEVEWTAPPGAPDDVEELRGAGVAVVVLDPVAPPQLRRAAAAGDDVVDDPPSGGPLQAGRHPGRLDRVEEPGLEGDHEPERLALPGQGRRQDPGVLGEGERGQQAADETRELGRPDHLGGVVDVPVAVGRAVPQSRGDGIGTGRVEVAPVAPGVAERRHVAVHADAPVDVGGHVGLLWVWRRRTDQDGAAAGAGSSTRESRCWPSR